MPKNDDLDEAPFVEFIDYKSGVLYLNSESLDSNHYWKPMFVAFSEYGNNDSENILKRKLVFGVSKEDSIMYENQDEQIRRIIENLTEEKARELGIPRRTYFDWKRKLNGQKNAQLSI